MLKRLQLVLQFVLSSLEFNAGARAFSGLGLGPAPCPGRRRWLARTPLQR